MSNSIKPYTHQTFCEALKQHTHCFVKKGSNKRILLDSYDKEGVYMCGTFETYEDLLKYYVWYDDMNVCGIKEL